jgi:histidine triad (HIT) family protein
MTLFEKIIARQIPADIVLEDDHVIAFRDINPQAPVHVLVVPKKPLLNVASATEGDSELLARVLMAAKKVAIQEGVHDSGYRLVFNNGHNGGQSVDHLHCHVLGGRALTWPPG